MKTLLDIKTEISAIQEVGADLKKVTYADKTKERKRKKELKAAQTKATFLKSMALYLEGDPNAMFIRKEVVRLTGRKNAIMHLMPSSLCVSFASKERKKWEKEQGIDKINAQLKTLKYILS